MSVDEMKGAGDWSPLSTALTSALPQRPVAMLLDFDGVILESAQLKVQAFLKVYENEDPSKLAQVLAHQRSHGGVTRRVKFDYYERSVFGRAGDPASVERLSEAYTRLVHDAVIACPFVVGAEEFLRLAHDRTNLHVVSGTPEAELADILQRRGLSAYFKSVHGAPATKREAFAWILERNGYEPRRTLAVGDATTELAAATGLGIPFLGVVPSNEPNPFGAQVPVVATLETLDSLIGIG